MMADCLVIQAIGQILRVCSNTQIGLGLLEPEDSLVMIIKARKNCAFAVAGQTLFVIIV